MNEVSDPDRQLGREGNRQPDPENGGPGPRQRWNDLLGRGIFETAIVAVGVILALMVDEWREDAERKELAEEAKTALRAELLANRDAIVARISTTASAYAAATARPDQVRQLVLERRNRPLLVNDSAWTMTIETGAIRWLEPSERTAYAHVYGGHERVRDVISNELIRWTDLAAFAPESRSPEDVRDRERAIRLWQAFALRSQFALCMNLGRHEQALGSPLTYEQLAQFCVVRPPTDDARVIYGEWQRRGWVSSTLPGSLSRQPAP